ncbi:MAG: hypothetical protein A3G02_02520 [Candidatus Yanofskybacteria bacterium RIFCSPLOWO2_12_FULL_44_13b]|uniref:Sortase n=1 Tax=Candidatus Yanofskybacteria bacterium RIFCSPLOWO2_02_FULL_44_18 TaxID=1802705 RepID=A0A1F8H123_9BACT|nr:MAG: hypothetical protein A3C01_02365 [Candidatus Yanofskybacteria bacterium RIFCSPHIGHO2_02_FULL_44_36b]OGN18486.1 MAG: hypothetical protein A3F50_01935 [Candidatus Yanofskybacteria bacterium RIFCSPHIGHO2_12_FULL_44_29b]OGN26360.1 MAG: hypothetical protein A3B12_00045 [Candidatus Yanofskybacteria bacterium RIFCSPLOWO2_01_FULL_44_88]OGN31383.1 MAG: hypothetical protein A3I96_00925 [Candidatus Yanofskybacteria bacterium RIFCSPLOWO2_02_FULL_44_18]OGN34623.1 MAG: hypothetical protein A3G02_0252
MKITNFQRTMLVFLASFLTLFFIFNFQEIFASISGSVETEQEKNERLTAQFRQMYGYSSHPEMVMQAMAPTPHSLPVAQSVTSQDELYIPKLGVKVPIIVGSSPDSRRILDELQRGVVLYPGSAAPGTNGTSVIIGHSSSTIPNKFGRVFAGLGKLNNGDVVVLNHAGREYTYTVNTKMTGSVDNIAQAGVSGDLILGTCWPIGTDKERILVTASLVR